MTMMTMMTFWHSAWVELNGRVVFDDPPWIGDADGVKPERENIQNVHPTIHSDTYDLFPAQRTYAVCRSEGQA